jgi:hypothetical protein
MSSFRKLTNILNPFRKQPRAQLANASDQPQPDPPGPPLPDEQPQNAAAAAQPAPPSALQSSSRALGRPGPPESSVSVSALALNMLTTYCMLLTYTDAEKEHNYLGALALVGRWYPTWGSDFT